MHTIVMAHPAVSGLTPSLDEANPELLRLAKKYLAIYRDFVRPFIQSARIYHHTPVLPGADGSGWCAIENAAADGSRAVAAVFRLVNAAEDAYCLRLRGVNPDRRYRVTAEPGGAVRHVAGSALAEQGLTIRLDTPLTSRLLLCEAME
jgi:alpha-galactosidase